MKIEEVEKSYYPLILQKFTELFESKGYKIHFEITATKKFSNKLKSKIPEYQHIIFYFLKDVAPDITGFISRDGSTYFVVIEVKNEEIKLDHIYQTRKYAELFDARFAFLISTKEIPEEIKRLSKIIYSLLSLPAYRRLTLIQFDIKTKSFQDWYPENPFEVEYYWR
jgi:hypothetical protein